MEETKQTDTKKDTFDLQLFGFEFQDLMEFMSGCLRHNCKTTVTLHKKGIRILTECQRTINIVQRDLSNGAEDEND